jgi:tetratricopeptide (TPR) repeat protein
MHDPLAPGEAVQTGGTRLLSVAFLTLLVLASTSLARAAAPRFDAERLRSLAKLPMANVEVGFNVFAEEGFTFGGEPLDLSKLKPPAEKAVELRKLLRGEDQDAERLYQLAGLYLKTGATNEARTALDQAGEYFRNRIKAAPTNGWERAQLGQVLIALGQSDEGEKLLQAGTELSPKDGRCWGALGDWHAARAAAALSATNLEVMVQDGVSLRRSTAPPSLSSTERERARRSYQEAKRCYDQAVAVAPDSIDAYTHRLTFRWLAAQLLEPALAETDQGSHGPLSALGMPTAALADLKRVAELTTNDVYAIAMAAFFDGLSDVSRHSPQQFMSEGGWSALSESSRQYVRQAMSRLEKLAESTDRAVAAGARAAIGVLQLTIVHSTSEAESNLRQAVALNPRAEKPWEALSLVLVSSDRWEDLVALGKERLKQKPSARICFMLAKAYERLGNRTETERQLRGGLELSPGDMSCRLGLVALQLQQATEDSTLAQIGQAMAELQKQGIWQAPVQQQMDFELLHGLYFALAGQREEAVHHFRRLLEVAPQNDTYTEALQAVGL